MHSLKHPLPTAETARQNEALLERLDAQIAELSAHIDAATYRLLALIHEFDQAADWGATGFRSCAHWLSWRTNIDLGAAREKVRVSRALPALPRLGEALRRGQISYSKVRALTRIATPENEKELLEVAQTITASHVERLVRSWRRVDRAQEAEQDERRRQSRYLSHYIDDDGMFVIQARLEPETGAAVFKAIEAATDRLYEEAPHTKRDTKRTTGRDEESVEQGAEDVSAETSFPTAEPSGSAAAGASPDSEIPAALPSEDPSREQMRADALGIVAESALRASLDPGTRGDRYQVVVHVDAAVLADPDQPGQSVLEGGPHVSAETSRRLACDSSKVVMINARSNGGGGSNGNDGRPTASSILDVGRRTRTIPPSLRRALTHRDRTCRFPGCQCTTCDAHHVQHWAEGGRTDMDNLVLLCRMHHRTVHEGGFRVEILASGEVRFYEPTGRFLPEAPAMPMFERDPLLTLQHHHREDALEITPQTAAIWGGGTPDLAGVIETLWE